MGKQIRIMVKKVNQKHSVETVDDCLDTYHNLVGGFIEIVRLGNGICMVCDDEGKLKDYEPNLLFPNDIIMGDVFFCSEKDAEFASLSDEQVANLEEMLPQITIWSM